MSEAHTDRPSRGRRHAGSASQLGKLVYSRDHTEDSPEHNNIATHNTLALQTQDLSAAFLATRGNKPLNLPILLQLVDYRKMVDLFLK